MLKFDMLNNLNKQKHSLEQGAIILLVTAVLTKLIGALFKIPLSSDFCLGDLGFGYFSAAYDLINPFLILSISGLPVAVSKFVSENLSANNADTSNKTFYISRKLFSVLGVIAITVSLIAVFPFVKATDNSGESLYCFLAIIPSFLFYCVLAAYRGYFEGTTNMTPPAVSSLIEALSKLFLGFSFAFVTVRLTNNPAIAAAAALFGITLGTALSTLYLHISFKKLGIKYDKSYKYDGEIVKKIIVVALPIALCSFSTSVVGLVDGITVRWQLNSLFGSDFSYFGNLFTDVIAEFAADSGALISETNLSTLLYGIRSKAHTVYNIVPTLIAFLGVSAIPHITRAFYLKDKPLLIKHIVKVLKYTSVICIPAGIGFIALNEEIMCLLYGEGASSLLGGNMLSLYGVATVFSGIALVLVNVLQGVGFQKKALANVGIGVAVKILFNLILCAIPSLNIYGSVISTIICYVAIFVLNIISLRNAIGFIPQCNNVFFKPLLSAIICCSAAVLIVKLQNSAFFVLLSIVVAVLIYVILIVIFKVFSKYELVDLPVINKFFID